MAKLQKSLFKGSCLLRVSLVVLLLWPSITARPSIEATPIVPVGVILDLNSTLGSMLNNAIQQYYSDNKDTDTRLNLTVRNVRQNDVVAAAEAASDLILKDKVHAILGPQNSEQAWYIVKLGEKYQVPVIWFPITGPSLLPPPYPYSDQSLNCSHQFRAMADVIKAIGWHSIVPIYEETEYGGHLIPCLTNVLKDMGIRMVNVTAIDSDSTCEILPILDRLKSMRTHVFLVHMSMDLGKKFILAAQRQKMMSEGYAWLLTQELSSLTNPGFSIRSPLKSYMQGALGVKPRDSLLNKKTFRRDTEFDFRKSFNSSLTIYGWWAYHTAEALAMAVSKSSTTLRNEIWNTKFEGKSGLNFNMINGQLNQSEYDVYNVIGKRERIIGYWSPKTRLAKNHRGGKPSDKYKLMDPLWPGDTLDKPPMIMIGVPKRNSFPEFVRANDPSTHDLMIGGFAYEVFLKAVDVLPFPLNNYKFVTLMPNKSRSDTPIYEDILCNQMKDLDAIIGDITIVAKRAKCVDFTLPYLDSRVAMVVSVKNASTSTNILFKPFKWSLWLILGAVFVTATITIIILEKYKPKDANQRNIPNERNPPNENNERNPPNETHERNKPNETSKFRYNPFLIYKIDVVENFKSRAAGWMVILTSFLFILVLQVYTANLTSILTKGKIKEPLFNDENEIKSRNLPVGYQKGSWVQDLLIKQGGFSSSQLRALESREEYNEALSNGTVVAVFDEIPYLALFLSKYKSRFMITGPDYKTGGFAFAFPKKTSLVSHFSNAILKVTQDVEAFRVLMAKNSLPTSIEDLEFEDQSDRETPSLSITNFGGLYPVLLSVVALFLCLSTPTVIKWLGDTSVIESLRKKLVGFKLEASWIRDAGTLINVFKKRHVGDDLCQYHN